MKFYHVNIINFHQMLITLLNNNDFAFKRQLRLSSDSLDNCRALGDTAEASESYVNLNQFFMSVQR